MVSCHVAGKAPTGVQGLSGFYTLFFFLFVCLCFRMRAGEAKRAKEKPGVRVSVEEEMPIQAILSI